MSIDTNDTGTIDLLDNLTKSPDDSADALREKLELATRRAYGLEQALAPLQALADALAALPVFKEMADDLDDLRDRVDSLEQSAEEIPTAEDVAQEIEYRGTIESAVEMVLADKADDPADNLEELAKAVADRFSVDVEIDCIDVSASASVSVS